MNITLTCDNMHIIIERPISIRPNPVFEYRVEKYYAQIDVEQLITGGLDLAQLIAKKLEEAHMPENPDVKAKREADYKDFLAGLQRKHGGNGDFVDQDVPQ